MEYFYLDIGPMIRRLQQKPEEFEIRNKCIHHRPTRHRLVFERDGKGRFVAHCNRVDFPISREQGVALRVVIENWEDLCSHALTARDPIARLMRWANSVLPQYCGSSTRWRQALNAAWTWVAVAVGRPSRASPKPRLRIVAAQAGDPEFPAGTSGETRTRKVTTFRAIPDTGQWTSPTVSSRHKRL
jgi:hypothetical protein